MPKYIQPFPGAYQIIPDEHADVEASNERLTKFIEKLAEEREKLYSRSHDTRTA